MKQLFDYIKLKPLSILLVALPLSILAEAPAWFV